jgi:hypothetical protein
MGRDHWDESFKLDYAFDMAQNYLDRLQNAGAQFYTSNRYQVMYLDGQVTELTRVSDTLKALEIHLGLKNLWCDRAIAGNLWLKASKLCRPLPDKIASAMDRNTHPRGLTKQMKTRINRIIESGRLAQTNGE